MNLEHVAFNIADPARAAEWYCSHLGMKITRRFGPPAFAHFIADARGQMLLELYRNPKAPVPDYRTIDPLTLHVAFQVDNLAETRATLLQAGATAEGDVSSNDDGDQLAMLRDPWGLAVQLVRRAHPML